MALARITGAGLGSICVLVAILWGCILGEHFIVQRANRQLSNAMTEIRHLQMRRSAEPASTPTLRHHVRPAIS